MPTISIVTAVIDGRHQYLQDAYRSIIKQDLPDGWDWQWVIQEDGTTGRPLAVLPTDPRISTGTGKRGGAAVARTVALSRVTGVLLRQLDADDELPVGALKRDILTLQQHPDIAWCVSPALDLLPDGSLRPGPRDPAPGPVPPGLFANGEQAGVLQVVGGTLCTYTELVRALGGWLALPAEEDVALLLAAEAVAPGMMLSEPGLYYRRWEGSSTAGIDKTAPAASTPLREVLLARVEALRAAGWTWTPPRFRSGSAAGEHSPQSERLPAAS